MQLQEIKFMITDGTFSVTFHCNFRILQSYIHNLNKSRAYS